MNKILKLVVDNTSNEKDKKNFFEKNELKIILDLYAKMVSQGSWKDYGLSISSKQVGFSVFKILQKMQCIKFAKILSLKIKILNI